MKYLLFFSLFVFLSQSTKAQTPTWQWIKGGHSSSAGLNNNIPEYTLQIGEDAQGNIYGASHTGGIFYMDSINGYPLPSSYEDFCVYSYSCEGNFRWVKHFGGYNDDRLAGISVFNNGDVIVSGNVYLSAWYDTYFGDSTIIASNAYTRSAFVEKMDKDGNLIYLKFFAPPYEYGGPWLYKQEVDKDGIINILTWFYDSTTWGNFHIPSGGNYMLKVDPATGDLIDVIQLDFMLARNNPPNQEVTSISFGDNGNSYIYLGGGFDTLYIAQDTIINDDNIDKQNFVLVKMDTSGQIIWHTETTYQGSWLAYHGIFGKPLVYGNYVYMGGTGYSDTTFMGVPINNPIAESNHIRSFVNVRFNKYTGAFVSLLSLRHKKSVDLPVGFTQLIRNGEIVFCIPAAGEIIMLNATDTIKPYFIPPNSYVMPRNYPSIIAVDTALTHYNWGIATKMTGPNTKFETTSMLVDHNNNIILGGVSSGMVLNSAGDSADLPYGHGFFIAKVALTNDSCGCEASVPSIAIVSSSGNTLTVSGSASNQPDSLYILWGDGDSTLYTSATNASHTYANAGPWNVCLRSYGFCGIEDTCLTNLYSGISPEAKDKDLSVTIYPNPFDRRITITLSKYNGEAELSVYDLLGKKVYQKQITSIESQLDLSTLKNGVYFLRILWEDGSILNKKIIKN